MFIYINHKKRHHTSQETLDASFTPLLQDQKNKSYASILSPPQYDIDSATSTEETDSDNSFSKNRYKKLPVNDNKHDSRKSKLSLFSRLKASVQLTPQHRLVLKCSFAYILGCLFTFVPQLNALIGYNHVSSHLVATATVFFNPAKSLGGMVEAAMYGWGYVLFALLVCFGSMTTTDYFVDKNLFIVAHTISLGFWLTGSTFIVSFLKAHWNKPPVATGKQIVVFVLYLSYICIFSLKFMFHHHLYHCCS